MKRLTARTFMLAAVAVLSIGTAPTNFAQANDKLTVGKASPTSSPMLPVDVGVATGIFAKHGLDVTIQNFGGGGKMHQAAAAGAIDIGVGAGPELALIAKGSPEIAIANVVGPPTFLGVAVPADSKAKSLKDLKGKKIAVSSNGSFTYWLAQQLAKKEGWGENDITIVANGSEPATVVAAFRTHNVDADIIPTSLTFQMEDKNEGKLLAPVSSYMGNTSAGTLFATTKIIQSNPDAVKRFLAGWFDTIDFMRKNKAETVKIGMGMTGFTEAVQTKEYDLTIGMYSRDGKFDPETLKNLQESFTDLKLVDSPPDMSKLYTEAYLPQK
ncbi:MAG TPA: ABC transporter substrate-binding protein [Stellaceae bacterium]|nr:ABC transporter substrate-binding protein [Stellaceae bacterium]